MTAVIILLFTVINLDGISSQLDINYNSPYYSSYQNNMPQGYWGFEPGNILSSSSNEQNLFNGNNNPSDNEKDRLTGAEINFEDAPKFLLQPTSVMYTMKDMNAVFHCRVSPADHVVVICDEEKFTIGPNSRLSVERFNSNGQPDQNGLTWDIRLEITQNMILKRMGDYNCHCQAWNTIKELNSPKFIDSHSSIIHEASLEKEFAVEPVSANLTTGSTLTLSCLPPKGNPTPDVYWMKNGQRITHDNNNGILINQYNHLIMENVRPKDSGNYTCVASLFNDKVLRSSNARVLITNTNANLYDGKGDFTNSKDTDNDPLMYPSDEIKSDTSNPNDGNGELTRRDIALFAGLFCAGTAVFIFIGLALLVISRRANSGMPEKRFAANQRNLFIDPNNHDSNGKFINSNQNQAMNFIQYPAPQTVPPLPPQPNTTPYQVQSGQTPNMNFLPNYPPTYMNCPKKISNNPTDMNGSSYQQFNNNTNGCTNHLVPLTPKQNPSSGNGKIVNSSTPSTNSTMLMNSSVQSKMPSQTHGSNGGIPEDYCLQQRNFHHTNNYSLSGGSSGSNGSNMMYNIYNQNQQGYVTTSGTSASTEHSHYQEPIFRGQHQSSPEGPSSQIICDNLNKSSSYVYDSVILEHNYEDPNHRQENLPMSL